jgi:hypothetical protein
MHLSAINPTNILVDDGESPANLQPEPQDRQRWQSLNAAVKELENCVSDNWGHISLVPMFELTCDSPKIVARPGTRLDWDDRTTLLVAADNDDPGFSFAMCDTNVSTIIVRMEIQSKQKTVVQFYSQTAEDLGFTPESAILRSINAGINRLFVEIRRSAPIRNIRIDPANASGQYRLHRIRIFVPV